MLSFKGEALGGGKEGIPEGSWRTFLGPGKEATITSLRDISDISDSKRRACFYVHHNSNPACFLWVNTQETIPPSQKLMGLIANHSLLNALSLGLLGLCLS